MRLTLFDLDNTLLRGDSDHAWGQFVVEQGLVGQNYTQRNNDFHQAYQNGTLDIFEYLGFSLHLLTQHPIEQLNEWRSLFLKTHILPMITEDAMRVVREHSTQGDLMVIVTATNDFVTTPIAEVLGIKHLIATRCAYENNAYTGKIIGDPCFREHKIAHVSEWLNTNSLSWQSFSETIFYSDSYNDLPLLQYVQNPRVVNPDSKLRYHAMQHEWQILNWN